MNWFTHINKYFTKNKSECYFLTITKHNKKTAERLTIPDSFFMFFIFFSKI